MQIVRAGNPDAARSSPNWKGKPDRAIDPHQCRGFNGPLADTAWKANPRRADVQHHWTGWPTVRPYRAAWRCNPAAGSAALGSADQRLVTLLTDRMVDTAFPEADTRGEDWRLYLILDEIARAASKPCSLSSAAAPRVCTCSSGFSRSPSSKNTYSRSLLDRSIPICYCATLAAPGWRQRGNGWREKFGNQDIERLADSISYRGGSGTVRNKRSWRWERERTLVAVAATESTDELDNKHLARRVIESGRT